MVEFALCIPFLLIAVLGIVYFGRYFFVSQNLLYAAQEGARLAAKVPNLSDPGVRDTIRGFTTDGALTGVDDPSQNPSPIYCALSAAKLLSGPDRAHGSLPPGAQIKILPFDENGSSSDTVSVVIQYPFGLTMDYSTGENAENFGDSIDIVSGTSATVAPVSFANMSIEQSASAAQEIYQD